MRRRRDGYRSEKPGVRRISPALFRSDPRDLARGKGASDARLVVRGAPIFKRASSSGPRRILVSNRFFSS